MRDSGKDRTEREERSDRSEKQRRKSIIGVTVSVALLAAILLIAFFVTPIVARQTSGEILPDTISSILIESGNAKIEMGSRSGIPVIQYYLTGSAEMKWKVDDGLLWIKADEGTLRVSLPKELELSSLKILSTSKDIELRDIDAEGIELVNSEDDIRIEGSDSSVMKASAAGSIGYELSSSESAELESDRNIKVADSTVNDLKLRWNDGNAKIENTYAAKIDAESFDGKLELGITNGISSITVNGEDRSLYPSDYLGADVGYRTEKGELKLSTAKTED